MGSVLADVEDMEERRRGYRALVVEDDPFILRLVERVLEREGFTVEGVRGSEAAIELLQNVAYDLLILDMMLPPVNGDAVLAYLDERKPAALRKVIVTTASPRLLACEFLERICKILTKPFDIDQLILLARECTQAPAA